MSSTAIYHPSRQHTLPVSHTLGWFVPLSLLLHLVLLWSVMQGRESIPAPAAQAGTTSLEVHLLQPSASRPHKSSPTPPQQEQRYTKPLPANEVPAAVQAAATVEPRPIPEPVEVEQQTADNGTPTAIADSDKSTSLQEQLQITLQQALASHFTYPLLARRRGWQGEVLLAFRLEADGRISDARVARSSGYGALDHAALSALAKVGRIKLGIARSFAMQLPVIYRLEG